MSLLTEEEAGVCRVCGCTDERACVTADGPCGWAEDDLCTACADHPFPHLRAAGFEFA